MPAGGGAAARAAATKRKKEDMQKKNAERLEQQKVVVEKWYNDFDQNQDGKLQPEELKVLLTHIAGKEPNEKALNFATRMGAAVDAKLGNEGEGMSRAAAYTVVTKFQAFVKEQEAFEELEKVFDEFDADKSGKLDQAELVGLLKHVAKGTDVTDDDAAYVIELCDAGDKDGQIGKEELMCACATWKQLVSSGEAPHDKKKSSACALL